MGKTRTTLTCIRKHDSVTVMLKDTIICCTVFLHGNSPCDIFSRQHQHNTHAIARVLILHKTFQN